MPSTPTLALPYPSPADTADVPRDMQALARALDGQQSFLPVGALILWPLALAPAGVNPNGKASWLIANGQLVGAVDYPKLAALLGQAGGNVTIPNLADKVPLGASGGRPALSTGGEAAHQILAAELPQHAHPVAGGVANNPGFNTNNSGALIPAGYTVPYGHTPWQRRFLGAPSGATAVAWFTLESTPGNDGSESQLIHAHSNPAHGHGHNITVDQSAAPSQPTPLMQPYLALNFAMRAA